MYGRYKCKYCGCEVDPAELHNGYCDECFEIRKKMSERPYVFTVSRLIDGFPLISLYRSIGPTNEISWDKWRDIIMEANPQLNSNSIQCLTAGTRISIPRDCYIGKRQ